MKYPCIFAHSKKILIILSITVWALLVSPLPVRASTVSGISIKAVIPENQVDKSKTYFDLRLEPGQKQTVQLAVRNGGNEPVIANIGINVASTGRNGIIQYNMPDVHDESFSIPIDDIAKVVTPEVTLPAMGEALVDIEIHMPQTSFDGCILGGVNVTAEAEHAGLEKISQENMQIINNYAHTVGLKMTQNDNPIKPDMHLKYIKPGLVNYRPMVTANLQNSEAYIIKGMHISAQVFRSGTDQPIKEMNMTEVDMAPNSNFDAGIDWNDKRLEPGDYRLKMRAEYKDQVWEWDEAFTIDNTLAQQINTGSVFIEQQRPVWPYVLMGVILLLLVFFAALWLGRRQKKKD